MARAGRRRQQGKRYPSGKLAKAKVRDLGTDGVQARRILYAFGHDKAQTVDAIGRAWCAGLLTIEGKDPAAIRDAGRAYAELRKRIFSEVAPSGGLYDEMVSRGSVSMSSLSSADRIAWKAYTTRCDVIARFGRAVVDAVNSLCGEHADFGPDWLDVLVWRERQRKREGDKLLPRVSPEGCPAEALLRRVLTGLGALV